jgi:hypothetical protein
VGIDLKKTIGLEKIVHFRPSSIDIDTISSSKGKITISFLRSMGVPGKFI